MNFLVVSEDEDAARSLCSALSRSGQQARWEQEVERAKQIVKQESPLVLVADTAVAGHGDLVDQVRDATPWTRVYLMADPSVRFPHALVPVVAKPFDAAELAELLGRELELAELDRGRRNLQARAEDLTLLVEASFEAIIGLDADGRIHSWNRGAAEIYGYSADEVIGRNIADLAVEHVPSDPLSAERRIVEVRRRRKDNSEIVVLLSQSPVEARSSAFHYVEVSLDVTERRALARELEHSERLAALGRIAATMAHEINNPLAVVRASATYIAEVAEKTSDGELADCARDLELAVERIGSFVQHVCGFARRDRPQLTDTSLGTAIDIAIRMVRPRARDRGVRIRVEPGPAPRLPHDPPRIAQAILNLLSNAVDAAACGGGHVDVRVLAEPDCVRLQVDDDGPGVAPEIAARLFEPFATTKPPGQGTGLGLAITRQILDDHRGVVTLTPRAHRAAAQSSLGAAHPEDHGASEPRGTRAEIVLPSLDASSYSILVVDADPSLRRALAQELRREGFDVLTAASLPAARELAATRRPHVLVTDIVRRHSDDACDLEAFRSETGARHLVVTADATSEAVSGDEELEKPWDRARLIHAVRQLCVSRR